MSLIEMNNVTKDYGEHKGIFNLTLNIEKGEMFGYCGTNGAGKTTTLRSLLGFIKPDSGKVSIDGIDPWKHPEILMPRIGYIPGEINFPDLKTGNEVIKSRAEFLHLKDFSYINELIGKLQLDVRGNPRRFSKGMKQKLAIILAIMHDPDILIFDEPTTGLDPLMRDTFMSVVREQHQRGKTIIMSSHIYSELEEYSDRVGLIVNGSLIDIADINAIRNISWRLYKIEFESKEDYLGFRQENLFEAEREQPQFNQVTVKVERDNLNMLFMLLSKYKVRYTREVKYDLEAYFKNKLEIEFREDRI